MENVNVQTLVGIAFILAAVALTSDPIYTGVKGVVVEMGGSTGLAAAVGMGLIALPLVGGIVLLRRA